MQTKPTEGDWVLIKDVGQKIKVTFLTPANTKKEAKIIGVAIIISDDVGAFENLLSMFGLKVGPKIIEKLYVIVKNEG
ncbi:MAG: hypothetical protein QG585_138 [Patescibacteria group bacterium]|nr:hypothetical protein [Patescibacteria group bacterium]